MAPTRTRRLASAFTASVLALLVGASSALLGVCGPFTDVAADVFCPFVLEIFYLGITTGTTPTTYDSASNVSRLQMAAFLSRTVDGVLKRGSRRAALGQFQIPQNETVPGVRLAERTSRARELIGAEKGRLRPSAARSCGEGSLQFYSKTNMSKRSPIAGMLSGT
ncbi:MAG TPA: hypothetical protein VKG01_02125, partial [Thermoanaerobaculia bacterium]|nr:hypothetical protein [Thermoanaerobaculia bacterium]